MKICDRCFNRDGSAVPAVDMIILGSEEEHLDLCNSCKMECISFVKNPVKNVKRRYTKNTGKTEKD